MDKKQQNNNKEDFNIYKAELDAYGRWGIDLDSTFTSLTKEGKSNSNTEITSTNK